ncbi:MAG: hypothetical protein P8N31_11820 [Planctomycetota bacterium]|nr:hypothetical protein [Planctomycetota bacterium]MDG2144236.1 hypothetical protein [Planctomycetota bacterium]
MPSWLNHLLLLGAFLLLGVVYGPYLRGAGSPNSEATGGFLGKDLLVLADAAGGRTYSASSVEPLPMQEMSLKAFVDAGGRGSVLSGASIALSRRLWGVTDSSAKFYRLENLLLLILAGLGLGNFVRRLLQPWTGTDHGRAAARALPAALVLHPLAVHAVADLSGRTELLGLAFSAWAAALYLRGRQERRSSQILFAGLLAMFASLSWGIGFGLALAIGIAEFVSARRYRPNRNSWRAAGLIALPFAICGMADLAMRLWFGVPLGGASPSLQVTGVLERLGVLVVSVPGAGSVNPGLAMAMAVCTFLLMMHPALRAARSAPRLWGWMLGLWFVGVLFAVFGGASVDSMDFSRAETLLVATAVVTSGLVVVATGVQGFRRLALPIALAGTYALLSLGQTGGYLDAIQVTTELRRDLLLGLDQASESGKPGAQILVLDPAPLVGAIAPFEGGIEHLLDPSLTGRNVDPQRRDPKGLTSEALLTFAREPEFDVLRKYGVLLLPVPGELVGPAVEGAPAPPRRGILLPEPRAFEQQPPWTSDPRSPSLNLDPFSIGALRVQAPSDRLDSSTPFPSSVTWSPKSAAESQGQSETSGMWIQRRNRDLGIFDLSSDLNWLLAGQIGRMWLAEGLPRVDRCDLLADLPGQLIGGDGLLNYEVDGNDWVFALPSEAADTQAEGDSQWVLKLLDLVHLRHVVLTAESATSGQLRFRGAARAANSFAPTDLAWSLERQVNSLAIWRHRGRVQE